MLIAQISDLHVNAPGAEGPAGTDAIAAAEAAVAFIGRMDPAPDVILATGDLAAVSGSAEEYGALRAAVAPLRQQVYFIPGNHDDRDGLRRAFPDHHYLPASGYLHYAIDDWPVRLVGLDTVIPGEPGGIMDQERLDWLDACLSERPDTPTVLFMHHPPFQSGIRAMDDMRCRNGGAMEALVSRHRQILRILCGHVHRPIQRLWGGTLAMIAPSSVVQLSLSLGDEAKPGYIHEPPALLLHDWDGGALTSHVVAVGDFQGTGAG